MSEAENQFEVRRAQLWTLIEEQKQRAQTQSDAASRWLFASLLALNGGAVVALLNSEIILQAGIKSAAKFFLWGIIAALAAGYARFFRHEAKTILWMSLQKKLATSPDDVEGARRLIDKKPGRLFELIEGVLLPLSLGFFVTGANVAADQIEGVQQQVIRPDQVPHT